MQDNKKIEQERSELNALINKGVSFEVKDIVFDKHIKAFGLIRKKKAREIKRKFTIEEPTLATLDRLSAEWIEFADVEETLKTSDATAVARTLAKDQAIRCARVIAIATLGEDRLIAKPNKGGVKWVEDSKKVEELTELFSRTIKPSMLYQLCVLISAMCNFGDFLNSIRLMSVERTTMPIRIEENN